jgi:hypothetical protein
MARGIANRFYVPVTWITIPPAKRQYLTQPVIYPELDKPITFPTIVG